MKRADKNVYLLGGSSLFNDIGSEMITPLLPLYIAALGGGGVAVGLISGLREGLASIFKLLGGWLSDKIGRRRIFVFLGYLVSVISRFLLALAGTWQAIIAFVSLERLGKSRDAPRDAIIAEGTKEKRRGRGFGIHQMMDTSGAILGTLLVLFLFWKFQLGFKTIIYIAGAISALSLLPLIWVKEPKFKLIKLSLFKGIKNLDKKLKYFIFVASVFTLGNFGLYMFLILLARQISNSTVIALALYALFSFMYAVFAVPFGKLSDKIGRKKVLMIGYVLFLGVAFSLIYLTSLLYVVVFFALYGLVFAITQSNSRAFVSDLAKEMKGTALGSYYAITGLVNIPAGLIAGLLWDINPGVMFAYISVVALISIILLGFVKER